MFRLRRRCIIHSALAWPCSATRRGITLGASGGIFDVNPSTVFTYGGIITGAGSLTKVDSGTLLLSGVNTYIGATNVNAGTLTLGANQNMSGTLALGGGTLDLGSHTSTFGSLSVTSSSTLDFSGTSILHVSQINSFDTSSITLTINNWTTGDYFYSTANPGSVLSGIDFTGFASGAQWNPTTGALTPVPEPSFYAMLMGVALFAGLLFRDRLKRRSC